MLLVTLSSFGISWVTHVPRFSDLPLEGFCLVFNRFDLLSQFAARASGRFVPLHGRFGGWGYLENQPKARLPLSLDASSGCSRWQ